MSIDVFPDPPEPDPDRRDGQSGAPSGEPRPEALHEWHERGFRIGDARIWIAEGFQITDADRWRTVGVYRPEAAREWRTAGATPYTVDRLLRAGMTPRDAVRWREFGVPAEQAADRHLAGETPGPQGVLSRLRRRRRPRPDSDKLTPEQHATMRALLGAGITAETARGYLDGGWAGAEAETWARRGIAPADALIFRALGLSAAESTRLLGAGHDAIAVMTQWWRAGVPIDEVAAWSAAGFTAAEAAGRRAAGADLERAKILRALSDDRSVGSGGGGEHRPVDLAGLVSRQAVEVDEGRRQQVLGQCRAQRFA